MHMLMTLLVAALGLTAQVAAQPAVSDQAVEALSPADPLPAAPQTKVIAGHSTHWFTVDLAKGVPARIVVDGDGDSDLDLYVYDMFGNLIASDSDMTDFCIARLTPTFTQRFTIRVVNRGRRANLYTIRMG